MTIDWFELADSLDDMLTNKRIPAEVHFISICRVASDALKDSCREDALQIMCRLPQNAEPIMRGILQKDPGVSPIFMELAVLLVDGGIIADPADTDISIVGEVAQRQDRPS
jgi:hypothetical protein